MSQPEQFPNANPEAAQGNPAQATRAGGIDRRTVIRSAGVVGVGAVGAAALAACGSSDTSKPAGAATSAAGSAGMAGAIKAADIPVGGGKVYDVENVVVTQPKAGEFKAFSAACTHSGCTVAKVENGTIDCECHGSKFDMATGAVTAGPAQSPLPAKTVKESGGSITVS